MDLSVVLSRQEIDLIRRRNAARKEGIFHLIMFVGGFSIADPDPKPFMVMLLIAATPLYYFFGLIKDAFSYVGLSKEEYQQICMYPHLSEFLDKVEQARRPLIAAEYKEILEEIEDSKLPSK